MRKESAVMHEASGEGSEPVPTAKSQGGGHEHQILCHIVRHGLDKVLRRKNGKPGEIEPSVICPFLQWEDFISVDYRNIDECVAIRNLVDNYVWQARWTSPLAIAVFGKPGSGKSTTVRHILNAVNWNATCRNGPTFAI
jgi:Cdc6-like AAA superfamily ATPase